jgi:hypothetical protein
MKRTRRSRLGAEVDHQPAAGAAAVGLIAGFAKLITGVASREKIPEGTVAIAAIGAAGNVLIAERGIEATRDLLKMLAGTLADGPGLQ